MRVAPRTRRWPHVGCLLLLISGCPGRPEEAQCSRACDSLAKCGYLPSPLGQDKDDCATRCEASEQTVRQQIIHDCAEKPIAKNDLCDQRTRECTELRTCLVTAYPDADIVGRGTLSIMPRLGEPVANGTMCGGGANGATDEGGAGGTSSADAGAGLPEAGSGGIRELTYGEICENAGYTRGNWFVKIGVERQVGPETTCQELIGQSTLVSELTPGVVIAGFRLRSSEGVAADATAVAGAGGAGGASVSSDGCVEFLSNAVALSAGNQVVAPVPIPSDLRGGTSCETAEAPASSGGAAGSPP